MTRDLTLADVGAVARKLATSGSRWGVRVDSRTAVHRLASGQVFAYTTASIWREVDQDYENVEDVKVGTLLYENTVGILAPIRDPRGLHVVLEEGLEHNILKWFVELCRDRGVAVLPPPSAQKVMELLAPAVDSPAKATRRRTP